MQARMKAVRAARLKPGCRARRDGLSSPPQRTGHRAMALRHVIGLDHVVVAVRDLDAAAAAWRRLGLHRLPARHAQRAYGSGNYTMMLGEDYMELLGVLTPTDHNAGLRAFLAGREGLDRAAFTTTTPRRGRRNSAPRAWPPSAPSPSAAP
jgi:catechol 2,3-dioxygenase-like lactoylglutathione lyase family enzyme